MVQAIRLETAGGPEALRLAEVEVAAPGPGEVRVRHTAIGLNFIDVYHRSGLYPIPLPGGIGLEAAGVIEAVGEGVVGLKAGDRIGYCWGPVGAYAQSRVMPANLVVKLPDDIDDATAAAALLKGCTAEYLVRRTYAVQPGDWVLVHAAAGGVGLLLGQWLAAIGAQAIGTVSSEAKAALARGHGYAHVIGYDDVATQVSEITKGAKCAVVYDSVGQSTWEASLDSCRPRGLIASFGNASGPVRNVDLGVLGAKGGLYVTRPSLFGYYASAADKADGTAALFDMLRSGKLKVRIDQRYPLADAARAHTDLEKRQTTGSSLLMP
jgi:NADPH:quinone reductase